MENMENRYLDRLSDLYPTIAAASTEIINLQAILNLPKGTEHFLTDVHECKGQKSTGNIDLLSESEDGTGETDGVEYG